MKSDFIRGAEFSRSRNQKSDTILSVSKGGTRTLGRSKKVIGERECDKAGQSQHKEREELTLVKAQPS